MTFLTEIEGHIANIGELRDIVGAMRSLASMQVQEAHRALPGVRRYADAMADAIASALRLLPERAQSAPMPRRRALVLCTAEHGFVGGYNERLLAAAEPAFDRRDALFVLGSRGAIAAQERGWPIASSHAMATRLDGVPETVRHLAAELCPAIARGEIAGAEAMFARYRQGGAATIERRVLFPLDPAAIGRDTERVAPLHNLVPQRLLERLVGEYVFALLTEAATESLASENAARFSAMEAAHRNVCDKLADLRRQARHARQDEITEELLDIVTGAQALEEGRNGGSDPRARPARVNPALS